MEKRESTLGPGVSPVSGVAPPVETRWKPGKSMNPGGVPKTVAQARKLAAKATPELMARMIEIAKMEEPKYAIPAAALVFERGLGKAGTMRELYPARSETQSATDLALNQLSEDQQARIFAILREGAV